MTMRIGGLASGMDIDSLVEKLLVAERAPLDKLEQKKQTYEWQRDAYREINTKLKTFDTYIADNFILKSMNPKTVTSSNSDYLTAVATSAASGTLSIEGVSQLATAARAVGSQVNLTNTSKVSDLTGTGFIELKALQSNGKMADTATKIEITEDMTVDQFVSKVNSSKAGVTMVFENGRFSITAKNTGDNKEGREIEIVASNDAILTKLGFSTDAEGLVQSIDGTNAVFQVNGIATERSTNSFTISGYSVTLKEKFNIKSTFAEKYKAALKEMELATEDKTAKNIVLNGSTDSEPPIVGEKDKYFGGNDTSKSYAQDHDYAYLAAFGVSPTYATLNLSQQETYNIWKNLSDSEKKFFDELGDGLSVNAIKTAINESSLENKENLLTITDNNLLSLSNQSEIAIYKEQAKYEEYKNKLKDFTKLSDFTYDSNKDIDTIRNEISGFTGFNDDLKNALKSYDKEELDHLFSNLSTYKAKASADDLKTKYNSLKDKLTYDSNTDTVTVGELGDKQSLWDNISTTQQDAFKKLAKQDQLHKNYTEAKEDYEAAIARETNAKYALDTAEKDAQEAGILNPDKTINQTNVNAETKVNTVQLTSNSNVNEIIDKIKEFVKTYNGLITDLKNKTSETKYRDFKPLTSLQRKEMEEKEIELWEEKAKSGMLRGDAIIQNGLSSLRSLIYESNPAVSNSKFNTLFNIGITTSRDYRSGGTLEIDEFKLQKALEEDPDAVTQLFTLSGEKEAEFTINNETKKINTNGILRKIRTTIDTIENNIDERAGKATWNETQFTLGNYLRDVNKRIDSFEDKLVDIENRYWRQFSAMETMISKANNQSTMLMNQFY
ncbi:flagellar filament capping protein FliD [Ureibacillus manganicus]|uniref:Flagellar hook-associated protein 2 n=1 Tax=Ureibacillus manganicus DSM 26584 TaxID=1384049 RepID=A0A0A3I7A6_9BACL|nr:flagellar filament capping protein FliD [Ureibacillus manganicus]KGR80609.1 hypothetical protein CD29_01620 [Ureibacillus manganicus DSM 26584]